MYEPIWWKKFRPIDTFFFPMWTSLPLSCLPFATYQSIVLVILFICLKHTQNYLFIYSILKWSVWCVHGPDPMYNVYEIESKALTNKTSESCRIHNYLLFVMTVRCMYTHSCDRLPKHYDYIKLLENTC